VQCPFAVHSFEIGRRTQIKQQLDERSIDPRDALDEVARASADALSEEGALDRNELAAFTRYVSRRGDTFVAGDDAFAWSDAGYKKLKGISDPLPVFRCRRGPAE
jgi:hypothetical protein